MGGRFGFPFIGAEAQQPSYACPMKISTGRLANRRTRRAQVNFVARRQSPLLGNSLPALPGQPFFFRLGKPKLPYEIFSTNNFFGQKQCGPSQCALRAFFFPPLFSRIFPGRLIIILTKDAAKGWRQFRSIAVERVGLRGPRDQLKLIGRLDNRQLVAEFGAILIVLEISRATLKMKTMCGNGQSMI